VQIITERYPPIRLANTPMGPPEKKSGTNPGNTIIGLWMSSRMPKEKIVPKVQKTNPSVAAKGEKGNNAATSTAGIA
ncbi:hypothetical protein AF389_24995, partial [Salmonella enterica subsp. enterica serovar Typhimurium]